MEAAKRLCDSLFSRLKNRKECGEKLLELAQELEDVHRRYSFDRDIAITTSVLSIFGAVFASVLTGPIGFLLLAIAGGFLVVFAINATSMPLPLVETGASSSPFNKATELIKKDEKAGTSIQNELQDLKDRCGEALVEDHADELDCEVTTQLMSALARRSKTDVPLDFLRGFNRATFFRHMIPGGLAPAEATRYICQALSLESREQGVISSGISLYDWIGKCENLPKRNQVTESSKFLRDSAREILDGQQKLKEQLDPMLEIIQKLFRMKSLIRDLGGYSLTMTEDEQKIMYYIIGTCRDNTVVSWLQEITRIEFVNLLRFCMERLSLPDLSTPSRGHIDIVFVAHGRFVEQFMPAGGLVPRDNIRDTILYSPWNCGIDSNAAFAIAQGSIQVTNREFYNNINTNAYSESIPLRNYWNRMRRSRHNIPVILLSPVTPEDDAWNLFHQFWMNRGMEIEERVIIPYIVPEDLVNAFGEIPLYILIFATSFILMLSNETATVHLAACLSRRKGSPAWPVQWREQYAYTSDGTMMTAVNMDNRNMTSELFRALRSLFDTNL